MQNKRNALLVPILTLGVFGLLNTEMGVIGMIPLIAETFGVSVPTAGWTVTIFAIGIAICGPVTPMLFSRFNRKHVMLISLGVFIASSVIGMLTTDFLVLLVSRAAPAVFHPVYVSMAFTVAAASVPKNQGPKAVARIFIGVSAGMVLGVPAAGFIASEWSYAAAMGFFAAVNIAVFILTLLFVPSMPAAGAKTYGEQVRILRRRELQRAVAAVIFTNGTTFGFFSFLADYLKTETGLAYSAVSFVLFLYGAANIVGNVLAGKWLAQAPARTIRSTTAGLAAAFMLIGFVGGEAIPMAAVVFFFGVLTGLSSNNSQFLISRVAHDAPEFGNGLFLSAANTGTAAGTALCGVFIAEWGIAAAVAGALLCLALSAAVLLPAASRLERPLQVESAASRNDCAYADD